MKMKITVLEDSVIELERLKNGIRKYGQQNDWDIEIDEYKSGEEYFSKNSECTTIHASAFFLDIPMGQMNGIEVAKRLRESGYHGIIVFLTAFREYVFRGYEVRALNYLLKPVKENTLFLCLDDIAKELSNNTYIYRNKQEIVSIPYTDILTFSSRLHYVDILTVDGKCYEQMSTLNKIIVHLPSEFIVTIPKGYEDECWHYLQSHGANLKPIHLKKILLYSFFIDLNLNSAMCSANIIKIACERLIERLSITGDFVFSDRMGYLATDEVKVDIFWDTNDRLLVSITSLEMKYNKSQIENLCMEIFHTREFVVLNYQK